MKNDSIRLFRFRALISLCILIPIGFGTKLYQGAGSQWMNYYAGGLLYEIFWCLAAAILWPRVSVLRISVTVLGITSVLEFLQLWHPPILETIRSTFIGKTLIGTTFSWWDFPHYVAGCFIGWVYLYLLKRKVSGSSSD